jgi:hypothetical protein
VNAGLAREVGRPWLRLRSWCYAGVAMKLADPESPFRCRVGDVCVLEIGGSCSLERHNAEMLGLETCDPGVYK